MTDNVVGEKKPTRRGTLCCDFSKLSRKPPFKNKAQVVFTCLTCLGAVIDKILPVSISFSLFFKICLVVFVFSRN